MKLLLFFIFLTLYSTVQSNQGYDCQEHELDNIDALAERNLRNLYFSLYDFDSMSPDEIEILKKTHYPDLYLCKHKIRNKKAFDLSDYLRNHMIDNFPLKKDDYGEFYNIPIPISFETGKLMFDVIITELAKYGYYIDHLRFVDTADSKCILQIPIEEVETCTFERCEKDRT